MTAHDYLKVTKDLREVRDAELAPHQEQLRFATIEAEESYNKMRLGTVKNAEKARALGGRNGDLLLSYLYKWHEEDCDAWLEQAVAHANDVYTNNTLEIEARYKAAVDERLACSSKV